MALSGILSEFRSSKNSKTRKLKALWQIILNDGPVRADTLSEKANMNAATCARLLDELIRLGLISAGELGQSTGGRKPILYSVNPDKGRLAGIEISNIYSTIVLQNFRLNVLATCKIKATGQETPQVLLEKLLTRLQTLLEEHNLTAADLAGIGIAADYTLPAGSDRQAVNEYLIPHLKEMAETRTGCPVTIGSGVNFAALAEYRLRHKQSRRLFFTTCDAEIRSSTILSEPIHFMPPGTENAFGHMTLDLRGRTCECGAFGCLNQYGSMEAIRNTVIQHLRRGKPSVITTLVSNEQDIDYHVIFKAIELADPLCTDALEEAAYYYGQAIANIILSFQPDVVVCGGTLTPKHTFFATVQKTVAQKLAGFPQIDTRIVAAFDSYEIVSQGAGAMVLESLLSDNS
ncbi:MAG TPA: hypothetical protein DIT05_16205 [Morganella sp. (in: Bacteria)]|nr:hypothetical protein [Morganella sp. (in: enterobacteria)]